MQANLPVQISARAGRPIDAGFVAFRHRGELRVTAIVKATFAFANGATAVPAQPTKIAREDLRQGGHPRASLVVGSDLVPYRPKVDVTFVGHAHVERGRTSGVVRLALARECALLDKAIHVYGDRGDPNEPGAAPGGVRPFDRMPIVYERAWASSNDVVGVENPVGTRCPNLIDPRCPGAAAGFGPVAREWPSRQRLLRGLDPRLLGGSVVDVPDGFDWRYFQHAPADQQLDRLRGDEWLVLDGIHPSAPRIRTRLPGASAVACIDRNSGQVKVLNLVLDTLAIDGDRQSFDLVWRASLAAQNEDGSLARLRVVASLDLGERASRAAPDTTNATPQAASGSRKRLAGTALSAPLPASADGSPEGLRIAIGATPFPIALPGMQRPEPQEIRGAPWAAAPAPPAPPVEALGKGTIMVVDSNELRARVEAECPKLALKPVAPEPPRGTMLGAELPLPEVAPFPIAAPAARMPSAEIVGAPWAAVPAEAVPKISNPLASTAPLLPTPLVGSARVAKANGVLYGKPRAKHK